MPGGSNVCSITSYDDDIVTVPNASLHDICTYVIGCLKSSGVSVIDEFMGFRAGNLILEEVRSLYEKGVFQKGELIKPTPHDSEENIRTDIITWVNGTESDCTNIGKLMEKIDAVISACTKAPGSDILSKYKLEHRSKAMIACYPGSETYYRKHVDNPTKDGRCITCIYYLNKNWDVKSHGGLLRVFPSACRSKILDIEPTFDRMVFFWSDERSPHEVLPTFALRFAITVWYLDTDERDKDLKLST